MTRYNDPPCKTCHSCYGVMAIASKKCPICGTDQPSRATAERRQSYYEHKGTPRKIDPVDQSYIRTLHKYGMGVADIARLYPEVSRERVRQIAKEGYTP